MKELKEWYVGLTMSSVQSNHVGNSRRQQRPTNLLQTFLILLMITVGSDSVWGTDYTTIANFKHLESVFESSGTDQILTGNDCNLVKFSWSGIENTTETIDDTKYYKFADNDSYVKVKFYHESNPNAPFVAGDIVSVHLAVTDANIEPGFILKSDKGGEKTVLAEKQSANTDITVSYTLTENEINTDGSISIYRTGGGYATRYSSFEVAMKRYNYEVILSQNTGGTASFMVTSGNASCALNTPVTRANVSENATIKLSQSPNSDILFWGWQVKDNDTWKDSWSLDANNYTVTKDTEIRPNFTEGIKINAYTNDANFGTVTISNGGKQATSFHVTPWPGDVTFTAEPKSGASFVGWYKDVECTELATDQLSLTYTNDNDELRNTGIINRWAKFNPPPTHTVSFGVVNPENISASTGTVTATVDGNPISSGDNVAEGKQIVFTATPDDGKIAWGWYNNGDRNYEGNPYTVTVGDADLTVNAVIHDGIILTAIQSSSSTNYGTTRIECSGDRGTSFHTNPFTTGIQFIATPKTGATFAGWYSDDACSSLVSNDNPYSIANPNESKTLYAKFTVPTGTYGITWSTSGKEEGCDAWFTIGDDETEYRESVFGITSGKKIYLHATDDTPKYIFAKYEIGSEQKWNNKEINVDINGADLTISADFCPAFTYRATANVPATLKITPNEGTNDINGVKQKTWDDLNKVTFSSSAESGLEFTGWYNAKGTQVSTVNPYVITSDIQKTDFTLEARYTIPQPIGGQRVKAQLTNLAKGNVPTWENGHLATDATSYNHVDIFRFSNVPDGNVNVTGTAADYTGIRFHANASTPFRVLVYINGETNPRIVTLESGEKEYTYTWSELGVPAGSVGNIARLCFAGQQNGSTDVTFDNVWVEKIDDPCHTFVTYDNDIKKYNFDTKEYTYTLATPEGEAKAVFSNITGSSRKGYTNEIKLENNVTITAPAGKTIKGLKIVTDKTADDLIIAGDFNGKEKEGTPTNFIYSKAIDNGNEVLWTHGSTANVTITNKDASNKASIAKIEIIYSNENVKHPALKKIADGQYSLDLSKIKADNGFALAYDPETNTVYNSEGRSWCGNIYVEFETPQDFSSLTNVNISYDGQKVANTLQFECTDADNNVNYWSYTDDGQDINDDNRAKLTSVKKLLFNCGNDGIQGAMTISHINFTLGHMAPKVALDEGMQTEYTISLGSSLNLSAHATQGEGGSILWSGWKSATPSDGPVDDGSQRWWTSGTYKFTPSAIGTYYFGARLEQDCSSHGGQAGVRTANADAAIITVNVVENTINKQLLLDFTDNTYTEPGESKGRQYRIYVPQSICNGSDADKANVPVVFSLHGTSNDNDPTVGGVQNFNELAETNKFIVVYPRGRKPENADGKLSGLWGRGWEATGAENEDTKFFRAIIADLKGNRDEFMENSNKRFTIDERRIYFTGFSNGGMMAYAVANTDADKFAAFASISGLPMNEMHMRHHNKRPVPFLHIHGTKDGFVKYSHMPTIVDNMLFRNGLPLAPSRIAEGAANGGATRYKMNAYTDEGCMPYYYFEIGTGSNTSDTGMDHGYQCTIGDKSSMQVIWEFFSKGNQSETPFTCPNTVNNPFEFKARINTANNLARDHGWQTNTSSGILAQYGESGGYTTTDENVYHTVHLNAGEHTIKFHTTGTTTNHVLVRIVQLCEFNNSNFDTMGKHSATITETPIVNNVAYMVQDDNDVVVPFTTTSAGEFLISIIKGGKWDNTAVTEVTIVPGLEKESLKPDHDVDTNFGGYFNYNNRLFAQWNFDLTDGFRMNARKLEVNSTDADHPERPWTADLTNTDNPTNAQNGTIVFTYNKALGTSGSDTDISKYDELTYDGNYVQNATTNKLIAAAAGLKFNAPTGSVKIYVDIANGQVLGSHLVVNENVKMYVPYVENSYRNDKNEFSQPQDHVDDYKNCMHHINRDILYIALNQGSIWDEWNNGHFISQGHVKNECIDLPGEDLFRNGGDEYVNGKNYNKADYMGKAGTPCIIRFNRETNIDRIGVNRNLTYSFYTEYISEIGMTKPSVRYRNVGSPTGQKIANDGDTWTEHTNALAFTYGGWSNSDGGNSYLDKNGNPVTDSWSDLGVYTGKGFRTWGNMETPTKDDDAPIAIDGFPVVTMSSVPATSERLMPSTSDIYHPKDDGVLKTTSYVPNITPWTLPCRGAYAKYEVSYPGVLNADIVMNAGAYYYIADEFGKPITQDVFSRTASGNSNPVTKVDNHYSVAKTDYVKLSFNAYPGKTYYIFSNTAGIGLSGFYFEPFVNRPIGGGEFDRKDVGYREMVLNDQEAFSTTLANYRNSLVGSDIISSPNAGGGVTNYAINYSLDAVKVTLNRKYKAGVWSSICLPYSINQAQLEKVFGVGTEVILLRDVQKGDGDNGALSAKAHFITHMNQDIIAGYPYFIKPKNEVSKIETYACLRDGERADTPMNDITSDGKIGTEQDYQGLAGFTFVGYLEPTTDQLTKYSYYLASDGYLYQAPTTYSMKAYRAWLKYTGPDPSTSSKLSYGLVDDCEIIPVENITGIEEIEADNTRVMSNPNIYSINGQVVRSNTTDLKNLPKGIYIINGKKYIAK